MGLLQELEIGCTPRACRKKLIALVGAAGAVGVPFARMASAPAGAGEEVRLQRTTVATAASSTTAAIEGSGLIARKH